MRTGTRSCAILTFLFAVASGLLAQEGSGPGQELAPEVACHSGSPLLLEITIPNPEGLLRSVTVEAPASETVFDIPPDPDREVAQLTVSPFMAPGVYDLRITLEEERDGKVVTSEQTVQIGFVDFVFGRDNLRFGNNADYDTVIGTYGEILDDWLQERFGGADDLSLVPLIDYMYAFFGKRSGRCYAFSGSELRFWLWPDLLPSYYDETYDLRAGSARTQREMNYLQLDMGFDYFIAGGHPLVPDPDEPDEVRINRILEEVSSIVNGIRAGEPQVAGFMGPDLHHAMLVYGYIITPGSGSLDLLVANNWKSGETLNLHSRDAETVRIFEERRDPSAVGPSKEAAVTGEPRTLGPLFEWRYDEGVRNREVDRIFRVPVRREYEFQREQLDALLFALRQRLIAEGRAIVVVEDAAGAWLTNGEGTTGYDRRRTHEDLGDVAFDRLGRTYRFEYPADSPVWLELQDDVGARVLYFNPGRESGEETAWIRETPDPAEGTAVHRKVGLTAEPVWEVVRAEE